MGASITEITDAYFKAQSEFFGALDVSMVLAEVVNDQRGERWSGDHGTVWWQDKTHGYQEVSVSSQMVERDGLCFYLGFNNGNKFWLVFSADCLDDDFEWGG